MNFEERLREQTEQINQVLAAYLPREEGRQRRLLEAMNYSMLAGGKRLRPMLLRLSYERFGGRRREVAEPFMAAIEMIHTHSLIHDDLPAMDNDEYRRGRRTTHVVFGEGMAILAGDGLLNYAYETACRSFGAQGASAAAVGRAMAILSAKTGIGGMIGGQSVDVELEGQRLDAERLRFIYELKTGALIEAALMIGGTLAGAGDEQIEAMERVGRRIGLAFQIRDDLLDVEGDAQLLGKPLHSDERNHKTTYVTLFGPGQAASRVKELTDQALEELDRAAGPGEDGFLRELLLSLVSRKA